MNRQQTGLGAVPVQGKQTMKRFASITPWLGGFLIGSWLMLGGMAAYDHGYMTPPGQYSPQEYRLLVEAEIDQYALAYTRLEQEFDHCAQEREDAWDAMAQIQALEDSYNHPRGQ